MIDKERAADLHAHRAELIDVLRGMNPDTGPMLGRDAADYIELLLAENESLRASLKEMRTVAMVAHNGDPWYVEQEPDLDVGAILVRAREALGEPPK